MSVHPQRFRLVFVELQHILRQRFGQCGRQRLRCKKRLLLLCQIKKDAEILGLTLHVLFVYAQSFTLILTELSEGMFQGG